MKLHERLTEWYYTHDAVQSGGVIANEIVDVVKDWIKTHHREETKYDADYNAGWMDCIETLEKDARQDTQTTGTRELELGALMPYNTLIHTET